MPLGALILGLMLFAMLVVLTLTLIQLHDSGGHIEAQDKKVAALFHAGRPLVERADALAADASPALRAAEPALRQARRLFSPLAQAGSGADLAAALERFPLLDSAVRRLAGAAIPLLDRFDPAALSASLQTLVDSGSAVLADLRDRNLLARAARSTTRLRKLLAIQRETRLLQQRSLSVQLRSLDVQLRSLKHVRSLDRKTLGEVPPVPTG